MVAANIERRINAATYPIALALRPGISNQEKSAYHRSAFFLLCTVVEALACELVKKHTSAPDHYFFESTTYREIHKIKSTALLTPTDIHLCEKIVTKVGVHDRGAEFSKMLIFLKNKRIITPQKYSDVEWVRKERNKIHLQGLSRPDTGYTRAKVERVSREIVYLFNKLGV